jgi:Protein of unknown function (DUF5661)
MSFSRRRNNPDSLIDVLLETQNEDVSFDEIREQCINEGIDNIKGRIRDIEIQPRQQVKEVAESKDTQSVDLKKLGDRAYSIYRKDIKPKEKKEKVEEVPCTIASRADAKARMNELIKSRNGGNCGRSSHAGPNGSGNVGSPDHSINVGLYPTSLTIEEYETYINSLFEDIANPETDINSIPVENKDSPLVYAVEELENELLGLDDISWQSIDTLMRSICKEHKITPKELHGEFKRTHGMIPDDWIKEQKQVTETCGWMPLDEITRINKIGVVYDVTFIFRGVTQRLKFFWPEVTQPTKARMQQTIEKLYPTAKLIVFYPSTDQKENSMVILSPMKEYYDPLQLDSWGRMSEESTLIYEEICTEEGNPVTSPYMVDENTYEVIVEDYDTGEEKRIRFDENGERGDGKYFCFQELYKMKAPLKNAKSVGTIAKKHKVDADKIRHQLRKGEEVEREHTTDKGVGDERQIALQHLDELPDYYTKLEKIEKNKHDD